MRIRHPHLCILCIKGLNQLIFLCVLLTNPTGAQEPASKTISSLINQLKHSDSTERIEAADALGAIGEGAKEAVPQLAEALKDPDAGVRRSAADALGAIGEEAKEAIPRLIEALKDPNESVRRSAADALGKLSTVLAREKATEFSEQLKTAADIMRNSSDPQVQQHADRVQQASDLLKLLWWEQVKEWVSNHPFISLAIAAYPMLLLIWLVILWKHPIWLWQINEKLASSKEFGLPDSWGRIPSPQRYLILVGFFQYNRRVLDAWVAKYIGEARKAFSERNTVDERKVYVPVPILLDDKNITDLIINNLWPIFSREVACLLIWSEAGEWRRAHLRMI